MAIVETFEEYALAVYARSLLDDMSNVDEIVADINKHVILKSRSVGLSTEFAKDIKANPLKKYTKSQIGQAIANLKRAKHAGKQLERKQKAYKRKANE
jgi:hypothetical protein